MANADSATHSETFAGLLCRSGDSQFVIPRPSVNLILDVAVTAPLPLARPPIGGFAIWRSRSLLVCSFYPLPTGCRQRTVALLDGEPLDTFGLALAVDHVGASIPLSKLTGPISNEGLGALFDRARDNEGRTYRALDVSRLRRAACTDGGSLC